MREYTRSIAGGWARRLGSPGVVAALLALAPMAVHAADVLRVPWQGLSMAVGKTVQVVTPAGAVVTGKVTAVEQDALVMRVKGELRVPRATLRVVRIQTKGVLYRAFGAFLGAGAGFAIGTISAIGVELHGNHGAAAGALIAGGGAAGAALGYLAGNGADRRWTTIEIVP
jgi:hypothetical protein